jgi:SRSO17 transposase
MSRPSEPLPVMELTPRALEPLVEEVRASHAIDSPLLQRGEPREWAQQDLHGLLLDLPRKSIAPMGLALAGAKPTAVRARHQCIGEGAWDDQVLLRRHWQEVDREPGADEGVLSLDGSDCPKQGQASVGVQRQDCGEVGKRANCQAGVDLAYASRQGYPLVERRRSLPQAWVQEEAYAARRRACGVPAALPFTPKPMWGWEMIQAVHQARTLRGRWVICDEAFGRDTELRDRLDAVGLWSGAEIPHDPRVWQQRPVTGLPAWSGRGRPPTRVSGRAGEAAPATVADRATMRPASRWRRHTIAGGPAWTRGLAGAAA